MFNNLDQNSIQFPYTNANDNVSLSQNEDSNNTDEQPRLIELLDLYFDSNPRVGDLVFQVSQQSPLEGLLPAPNAKVTVSKPLGNDFYVSKILTTDADGKTKPIALPTVASEVSLAPGDQNPFSTYNASIELQGFPNVDIFDIRVFENITSIQPVILGVSPIGTTQPIQKYIPYVNLP